MQNNLLSPVIHLESSLHSLKTLAKKRSLAKSPGDSFKNAVDTDLSRAFLRLDLHASAYSCLYPPWLPETITEINIPGRFSSLIHAKDVYDEIAGRFSFFYPTVAEEYK
jgi:hypothetical protein